MLDCEMKRVVITPNSCERISRNLLNVATNTLWPAAGRCICCGFGTQLNAEHHMMLDIRRTRSCLRGVQLVELLAGEYCR
jgi:hypothetical protein